MNPHTILTDLDSAAAHAQAFAHIPMIDHPTSNIREQLRQAEIDVLEATMRRDTLMLVLSLREARERRRTAEIMQKICA